MVNLQTMNYLIKNLIKIIKKWKKSLIKLIMKRPILKKKMNLQI